MPTAIEIQEPEIREESRAAARPAPQRRDKAAGLAVPERVLFSDSLLETGTPDRARRGLATTLSVILQCVLVGFMLILPLMFTDALPAQQFLTFLVAPPPPPPPPPPAAAVKVVRQTDVTTEGQLRTPTRIPRKVEMIREEEPPLPSNGGVVGGIPGGVPGGQLNGVIGGIISSTPIAAAIPRLEPVVRIRISQGVTQGMLINKIEPAYPQIALSAHIAGVVTLKAIIGRDGSISELHAVNGHPILIPAAIDAVKQWRYRPYLLNGEPVEVETIITVTFQIQT